MITGKLQRHKSGVLISTVDLDDRYYDSTAAWRERSMQGILHSGMAIKGPNQVKMPTMAFKMLRQ